MPFIFVFPLYLTEQYFEKFTQINSSTRFSTEANETRTATKMRRVKLTSDLVLSSLYDHDKIPAFAGISNSSVIAQLVKT